MKKYTRADPFLSQIKQRQLLTGFGSTKQTYHIVLDIDAWEGSFKVGDSLAILPSNSLKEVDTVLKQMGCIGDEQIVDSRQNDLLSLREFLTKRVNLSRIKGKEGRIIDHVGPMAAQDLVQMVMPLLPRFYSITNSPLVYKNEIHLLVAYVQYSVNGEERLGVGSHFLCDFAKTVPVYVQSSNHFTLPNDSATPMIMIGPGTGVAPFRAFMQEREHLNAKGRHWLFFGERNRKTDFYYEDYWNELTKKGLLKLTTAFSRDQKKKEYVQHKLLENKKELWEWVSSGAFLYVCGDANEMAKEVDVALQQVIKDEGNLTDEESIQYLKKMRHEKRYLLDVY